MNILNIPSEGDSTLWAMLQPPDIWGAIAADNAIEAETIEPDDFEQFEREAADLETDWEDIN